MRWINVGRLFLLSFLAAVSSAAFAPATARGQSATGQVLSLGYNGSFRPDAWVPMVVSVKPAKADAAPYQLRVYQHDLDGDRAIYTKNITVNGTTTVGDQLFWMYFLPEPLHKGLPDPSNSGTLRDLQKALAVFLCDPSGKQIAQLPITSTLSNVDPVREGGTNGNGQHTIGTKLVLAVSANGGLQPQLGLLNAPGQVIGLTQDMEVASIREHDLPEDPLGYEPVDAVLWLDGDPADLDAGGAHGFAALTDWVRFGGQLVITQPTTNWQQTGNFGELLPVTVTGVATKAKDEPLEAMAVAPDTTDGLGDAVDDWQHVPGPFQLARATARPGTVVERWIDWTGDAKTADVTPYLARRAIGLGQVTWVAQPLTSEAQPTNNPGWPYVWMTIMGWRSDAYTLPPQTSATSGDDPSVAIRKGRYQAGGLIDLGYPLMQGMNLGSKGAWLIVLAIGFFIAYWLIAGPGTYGYLVAKRRQGMSWFLFAAAALVATAVTIGVVKLVLRGPPEVKHITMIRVAPGQPAIAYCRFGLYIPRDGEQTIELGNTTPGQLSYLAPLAKHPGLLKEGDEFPTPLDYEVPVRDLTTTETPVLKVPYRSSLKSFEARWVGDLPAKVGGGGLAIDPDEGRLPLKGTLTNDTGHDLTDVYLAFHVSGDKDWVVYVPEWQKGTPLDIQRDLNVKPDGDHPYRRVALAGRNQQGTAQPGDGKVISDELAPPSNRVDGGQHGWQNVWYSQLRTSSTLGADVERSDLRLDLAYPVLSLLDRLPPMPDYRSGANQSASGPVFDQTRTDLLARGARMLDAGPSLSAGQLLVLATVHGPLPIPVQVDGDPMAGDGTTLYQFLLPIDRSAVDKPPATQPAAK